MLTSGIRPAAEKTMRRFEDGRTDVVVRLMSTSSGKAIA
jgi:hypothetical protein